MSAKELRVDCPSCRSRLSVDTRTSKVVTWQPPERFGGGGRPVVDEDDWSRAARRVAERGARGNDRFESALAKETLRPRDLDDLFARGRGAEPVASASASPARPQPHTEAWYRWLSGGECAALSLRASGAAAATGAQGVTRHGGARVVIAPGSAQLFDVDLCSEEELRAALDQLADGCEPTVRVLPVPGAAIAQDRLLARGWRPTTLQPVLVHDLQALSAVPGDVSAVRAGDFEAWCRVAAHSSDVDRSETVARLRAEFGDERWRLFLAREHGQPVAAAALLVDDGVAVLTHACTMPEHRGRGHHRSLIAARLAAAATEGAHVAISPFEVGGASRSTLALGFQLAFHQALWVPHKAV